MVRFEIVLTTVLNLFWFRLNVPIVWTFKRIVWTFTKSFERSWLSHNFGD